MIARNIAPGLCRHFRIEELPFYKRSLFQEVREQAKARIYPSGKYQIFASDNDATMIDIARKNAKRAGVNEDIIFGVQDFLEESSNKMIVTNPPYGHRLQGTDLEKIYQKLPSMIEENGGGCITSYELKNTK
jgi:putative N6-adenine-specific DNA methylase